MKFVCERCHTRYSIADDKVRQKILKIRCKTCENVITVRDPGPSAADGAAPPPPPRAPAGGVAAAREWFVAVNGEQVGPMTRSDAARRILQARTDDEIYVWKDGLDGWKAPSEVPAIHQEVNALKARTVPPRVPTPAAARAAAKAPVPRTTGVGKAAGAGKGAGHAPLSASTGGRGSVPATARLAQKESYAEEEHTQIQPFDAGLLAPEGFARPAPAGGSSGSVLPFTAPGKTSNGEAAAAAPAALDGLFNDLTPVPRPSGAVAKPVSAVHATSGFSQLVVRRSPLLKFVAAGGVVAILITLVVLVLVSHSNETRMATAPSHPVAVKPPPPVQPAIEPEPKPTVSEVSVPPPAPTVKRGAKGQPPSRAPHVATPVQPPALEPAPLSPEQASAPRRPSGGTERRVPEFKGGNRASPSAQGGGDGPSEAMINSVVKKNQTTIKSCYERALKRDDRLRSGRIDVTADLGPSGTVKAVAVTAPPEFVTVEACIKTAVRRWAFPVAPHEYRVEFPLILQGNL
jgi:predicted Zn finger-like uncharacterized protein